MSLPVPSIPYFAPLAVEPDVLVLASKLRAYHDEGAGQFNYNPFRDALVDYLGKRCDIEGAILYCLTRGAKAGRQQNVDAVNTAFPFLTSRIGFCSKLKRDFFSFRYDLKIPVGPLVVTRDGITPVLVTTQPRKRWEMSTEAWRLWATILSRTHAGDDSSFLFDDLENPIIEILDLSAKNGNVRELYSHRFHSAQLMSDGELTVCLQRFADAHDILLAEGFVPKRMERRSANSDEPDLFDTQD